MSDSIGRDELARIARLCHLELGDADLERATRELDGILGYVRLLQELDVSAVPPTAHVQIERLPLRDDEPSPSLPVELALREAPRAVDDGFAVPAFVDEG